MVIKRDTLFGKINKIGEKGLCNLYFFETFRRFYEVHNSQKETKQYLVLVYDQK